MPVGHGVVVGSVLVARRDQERGHVERAVGLWVGQWYSCLLIKPSLMERFLTYIFAIGGDQDVYRLRLDSDPW